MGMITRGPVTLTIPNQRHSVGTGSATVSGRRLAGDREGNQPDQAGNA